MPLSDVRKYLAPVQTDTKLDEYEALAERANATESAYKILTEDLGCDIPSLGHGSSVKFRCPLYMEHSDIHDKNCRFYFETDKGYCFAVHGVLDPVFLRSIMWSVGRTKAANMMLEKAGLTQKAHWRTRITESQSRMSKPQYHLADATMANAALTTELRKHGEYLACQYDSDVQAYLAKARNAYDPTWSLEQTLTWIEKVCEHVLTLCRVDD